VAPRWAHVVRPTIVVGKVDSAADIDGRDMRLVSIVPVDPPPKGSHR
jgi:hypothetical protein